MLSKRVKRQLKEFIVSLLVIGLFTFLLLKYLESRTYVTQVNAQRVGNENYGVEITKDTKKEEVLYWGRTRWEEVIPGSAPEVDSGTIQKKEKVKIASVDKDTHPVKIGASENMQEKIDYAWEISKSRDFIYTVEAENDRWDENRISPTGDWGVCQINKASHPEVIKDKNFKDWKWQIRKCWDFFKGGVRFYGYDRIDKVKDRFVWEK